MYMERPDISPAAHNLLQHSQPTTTFVKRNFFMLQKLLVIDRKFKIKNVKQ